MVYNVYKPLDRWERGQVISGTPEQRPPGITTTRIEDNRKSPPPQLPSSSSKNFEVKQKEKDETSPNRPSTSRMEATRQSALTTKSPPTPPIPSAQKMERKNKDKDKDKITSPIRTSTDTSTPRIPSKSSKMTSKSLFEKDNTKSTTTTTTSETITETTVPVQPTSLIREKSLSQSAELIDPATLTPATSMKDEEFPFIIEDRKVIVGKTPQAINGAVIVDEELCSRAGLSDCTDNVEKAKEFIQAVVVIYYDQFKDKIKPKRKLWNSKKKILSKYPKLYQKIPGRWMISLAFFLDYRFNLQLFKNFCGLRLVYTTESTETVVAKIEDDWKKE